MDEFLKNKEEKKKKRKDMILSISREPRHRYFSPYRPPPKIKNRSAAYMGTFNLKQKFTFDLP